MRRKDITVGFSVNPEISYEYAERPGEKGALDSFTVALSGTSANVASALKSLGYNPLLVVPCEKGESDAGHLMEVALRRSKLTHVRLNILEQTPLAVYPVNGDRQGQCLLYGRKGTLTEDTKRLDRAIEEIRGYNGHWRIVTGIDQKLSPLAWHLLGEEKAFRVLCPSYNLCLDPAFRSFSLPMSPMSRCDLLVLNKHEFETIGQSEEAFHEAGVSLVVVTDGERGGRFSLCNETTNGVQHGAYEATLPTTKVYPVGAGDWFLGGLAASIMDAEDRGAGTSIATLPYEVIMAACDFGAKVAGLKVTMRGGSRGPSRQMLMAD